MKPEQVGREPRMLERLATNLAVRVAVACCLLVLITALAATPVLSLVFPFAVAKAVAALGVVLLGLLGVVMVAAAWGYDVVRSDIAALDGRWDSCERRQGRP